MRGNHLVREARRRAHLTQAELARRRASRTKWLPRMGNIIADLRYYEAGVSCSRSAGSSGIPEVPVATESTPTHGRVVVSLIVDDCCPLRVGRAGRRTEDRGPWCRPTGAIVAKRRCLPSCGSSTLPGFGLRMQLAPYDDHDEVLRGLEQHRSPEEPMAWESYQPARVAKDGEAVSAALRARRKAKV